MVWQTGLCASVFVSLLPFVQSIPASINIQRRDALDDWIASQTSISRAGVLANIGSTGAKSYGAAQGLVLASPSTTNPDCNQAIW